MKDKKQSKSSCNLVIVKPLILQRLAIQSGGLDLVILWFIVLYLYLKSFTLVIGGIEVDRDFI